MRYQLITGAILLVLGGCVTPALAPQSTGFPVNGEIVATIMEMSPSSRSALADGATLLHYDEVFSGGTIAYEVELDSAGRCRVARFNVTYPKFYPTGPDGKPIIDPSRKLDVTPTPRSLRFSPLIGQCRP